MAIAGRPHEKMFSRMLRRKGFYRVKDSREVAYMKHSLGLGGIYVYLRDSKAIIKVRDLKIEKVYDRAKPLERFIDQLNEMDERYRGDYRQKMAGS